MPPDRTDSELNIVLETALDAVIVMRSDGTVAKWNDKAVATFGWSQEEAIDRNMAELIIPPKFRLMHAAGLKKFLESGEGPILRQRIEIQALRKSGEEFSVELSISPYYDNSQLLFFGFLRDITDRQSAARVLKKQALVAQVLHRAVSFAADSRSFEDAVRICLESVHKLTEWPIGHAYLPTEGTPTVLAPSNIWYAAHPENYDILQQVTSNSMFARGEGLPGKVWESGEPIWIADVDLDPTFIRVKMSGDIRIKSAFGFPIKSGGETIAVIEFFSPAPFAADEDMMLTLRSIGDQVGRVFERRQAAEALLKQTEYQTWLLAELNHRVKNTLSVVMGIASQTIRNSSSLADFNERFLARLNALSGAHKLLASHNWKMTPLQLLVDQILAPYDPGTSKVDIEGAAVSLEPKAALTLSLILHELVTNASKYGALSSPGGRITIRWETRMEGNPTIRLLWRETGVPGGAALTKTGFGTRMIETATRHELKGEVIRQFNEGGLEYEFEFPFAGSSLSKHS